MSGRTVAVLSLTGGILLGLAYPPFETGMLAAAGFVPLLLMIAAARTAGAAIRASYATFFVMNAITLHWPGGFVHGKDLYLMVSGALLLVAHPLFLTVPIAGLYFLRRTLGARTALLLFPVVWTAFEYVHASTQVSFPWLTLGTTQSYDLAVVQLSSITGVYGLSFWLAALNALLCLLYGELAGMGEGRGVKPAALLTVAVVLLGLAPRVAGTLLMPAPAEAAEERLTMLVIQPDVDPFEKWTDGGGDQVELLIAMTDSALRSGRPDLILWPETAVPFYLRSPSNAPSFRGLRAWVDTIGVPLLSGIPDIVTYDDPREAPRGSRERPDGVFYETFNSAILILPAGTAEPQTYAKALLVPFAERVPYSDVLGFLNAARWNFGLGGWSPGRDTALFRLPARGGDTIRFGNLICYESVFPGYVAGLVRRGASFLTVVTNDSWWGRTSGPYQHRQFAVFRAVENRRWVVQCANGGISFAVDPAGRIVEETELFTRAALTAEIGLPSELTFYSRHGDWLPEGCLVISTFTLFGAFLFRRPRGGEKERTA